MTADRAIRYLTALVVTAVAGFAAVISYGHIYGVALHNGQTELASVLLPLSVDGLILAASLVLLHEAQQARPAPLLGQAMLALGVGATLAANALYGLAWGPLGVVVSAWPAVAFIGAAEMVFLMVRRSARPAAPEMAVTGADTDAGTKPGAVPVSSPAPKRAQRRARKAGTGVAVARLRERDPGMTTADIARRLKVNERTVRRHLVAASANGHGHADPGSMVDAGSQT